MAVVKDYLADGVPQSVFNTHTHDYRKITQVAVDRSKAWSAPVRVDIVDDLEVVATDGTDLEAVGITVATQPTEAPNA